MKKLRKTVAVLLALVMVLSLAACTKDSGSENPTNAPTQEAAQPTKAETKTDDNKKTDDGAKTETTTPEPTPEALPPLEISVSLPSDNEHVADGSNDTEMQYYQKLIDGIQAYTNTKITWEWLASATYYDDEHLGLKIATGDVADVLVVGKTAAFLEAAENGLFWDLAPYIDEFDNLATIPEATRQNASYNGKMYGIPRSRTLARNGLGYRLDWLNNLGLSEPTTWEDFHDMLYAFTYNDPDGNGVDDTVGLGLDNWGGVFNIMMTWFGVPNEWGLDSNGDLIYKVETEEYKTALKAFRELYSEGVINNGANGIPDFREVDPGKARDQLLRQSLAGCGVQVLDDQRKVETYFEDNGLSTADDPIYTLQGYVDTGKGPLCYPTTGMNNMIAISTKTVKTEDQLRRVLGFLNDLNDGELLNLIEYGWEGETYRINDEGYVELFTAEELEASGVGSTKYNYGFNQVIPYFTAAANARPVDRQLATSVITTLEQQLYADDIQYCVPNYGASYTSDTYVALGGDLDKIINDAQLAFIVGEIDESGLNEAIKTWKQGGGDQVTKEMNALYHK
ncbi:MAG: extracellular solute-binding protein [Lachnospiraceae bacterium]|nr:extracellular solute-binding protein [Lachnospiraceae bacterium]